MVPIEMKMQRVYTAPERVLSGVVGKDGKVSSRIFLVAPGSGLNTSYDRHLQLKLKRHARAKEVMLAAYSNPNYRANQGASDPDSVRAAATKRVFETRRAGVKKGDEDGTK